MLKIKKLEEILHGKINGDIVKQTISRLNDQRDDLNLLLKINITVKNPGKENHESSQLLIGKMCPMNKMEPVGNVPLIQIAQNGFVRELKWYSKILPLLKEFEIESNVEGFTNFYAKYYGGRLNLDNSNDVIDNNALIVLENLQDYTNIGCENGFDYETSKVVLKTLSRFHALPIALRQKKPQEFEYLHNKILSTYNGSDEENGSTFSPCDGILEILTESDSLLPYIQRFETFLNEKPFVFEIEKKSNHSRERWATFVHNNFWIINILIGKSNLEPKIKFEDFENVCCGSLAEDLVFFLLLSVEISVQKTKIDDLIRYYFDNFIENLKLLHVDVNPFTYEEYLKELEIEVKREQFYRAMMFVNCMLAEKRNDPNAFLELNMENIIGIWKERSPSQKDKILTIARICAERNWI